MDTIYKASVNIGNSSNRVKIYFLFANSKLCGKSVSIGKGIHTGPEWQVYHITTATEVHHTCPEGTWILYLYPDRSPEWALRKKDGHMCEPTISLANEPKMKGKHYEALIEGDMLDAWRYSVSALKEKQFADINREIRESIREKCSTRSVKDVSLSKETLEKAKDALFGHTPFYDMLSNPYSLTAGEQECYESLKKGDDKMSKYLWHVILFNTDTEKIDFKGYIPACSGSDAQMLAAQTFGKFDPKVHAVNCKQIMSYGKEE